MRKNALTAALGFILLSAGLLSAQDLGPQVQKLKDGVYVYVGKDFNSNCGIVITSEGVVLIDSGHNPTDSRAIAALVKKLTPLPVRFLIDTEPHPDHTTGHFVFSPPATIVAHYGATESMNGRDCRSRNAPSSGASSCFTTSRRISICSFTLSISQERSSGTGHGFGPCAPPLLKRASITCT